MNKKSNNQEHIIEAIKRKDFDYVWEQVKYIGYKDVPNVDERYIIFNESVNKFNPYQNNNFILFYKKGLKNMRFDKDDTFYITVSPYMINKLKENYISPKDSDRNMNVLKHLKQWKN